MLWCQGVLSVGRGMGDTPQSGKTHVNVKHNEGTMRPCSPSGLHSVVKVNCSLCLQIA